jgi:hypothetical protein
MLQGVIYLSVPTTPFSERDLAELAEFAAQRNAELDITGYLFFEQGHFVQYIEGESSVVQKLLNSIRCDPRHRLLHVEIDNALETRRFPSWRMRRVSAQSMISLEHILQQHLAWINSLPNVTRDAVAIWRMADRLSALQDRMSTAAK